MKRFLITLLLICTLIACLPSCGENIEENPEFEQFNNMFAQGFDSYTITVTTTTPSGMVLNKKYVVTTADGQRKVDYTVETLNQFVIENGAVSSPSEYKTVSTGTYTEANADLSKFNVPQFKFSYKYIDNDMMVPGKFSATVKSLSGFAGFDENKGDGKFSLSYVQGAPKLMQITYTTENGNTNVVTYQFN